MTEAPLDNTKVLDLTEYGAGPWCTMMLGDLGAEVIKLEKPGGDSLRSWGAKDGSDGYPFLQLNRNKRSISLDLKHTADRSAAQRLAEQMDVVVENFKPGVAEKLGLSYEQLRRQNPGLIYCSISGYGQTGPFSKRGGFDLIMQGHGGLMSVTGEKGGAPMKTGVPIIDFGASAHAVVGILAACLTRAQTGMGQYVDISLFDVPVSWLGLLAGKYWATGERPTALGSAHPMSAPYQAFSTADGYITIAAGNQQLWTRVCNVLGLTHLIEDARFINNEMRAKNQLDLVPIIETVLKTDISVKWIEKIASQGIPCGPIYSIDEVLSDPQVLHRQMVLQVESARLGKVNLIGSPIKLSETPVVVRRPPPALGEHNEEIAKEYGLFASNDDMAQRNSTRATKESNRTDA